MEKVTNNNLTLAIIIRGQDWEKSLNFFSSEEDYIQAGTWWYEKGKKVDSHIHLECPRQVLRTQDLVYVKQGRLRADIYAEDEKLLRSVELKEGDTAIFLRGGHGFEILEDDTKVLEVKNGPFLGLDKDKRKFYGKEK